MKFREESLIVFLACLVSIFCLNSCSDQGQSERHHGKSEVLVPGTAAMMDSMRRIIKNADIFSNPYINAKKARKLIAQSESNPNDPNLIFQACNQLILAGENEKALVQLESLNEYASSIQDPQKRKEAKSYVLPLLSLAYWRMAESANCIGGAASGSCILPIKEEYLYRDRKPVEMAIKSIEELLVYFPDDWNHVWLLNVANMARGTYPEGVSERFRIPESEFAPKSDFPYFQEEARDRGISMNGTAGASISEDFNNDGLMDLFVTSWGIKGQCKLFIQTADGQFDDVTEEWGLDGMIGGLNAIQGDYNNDGFQDIFLMRGAWLKNDILPNSLFKNVAGKGFEDVTIPMNMYDRNPCQAGVWGDFNNDGWLDLYVGNETPRSADSQGIIKTRDRLYINQEGKSFTDQFEDSGIHQGTFTKGVSAGDINGDGWLDLYVSNFGQKNALYLNSGARDQVKFNVKTGCEKPISSFPCWMFDFNQDGLLDIFSASFYDERSGNNFSGYIAKEMKGGSAENETSALYIQTPDGEFKNIVDDVGLNTNIFAMGSNYGDLNYDGYPDMYLGTGEPGLASIIPNRLFMNIGGTAFKDVSFEGGFAHIQKGHAVSFADMDQDGDLDLYATMGGAFEGDIFHNALFVNPGFESNYIKVKLIGKNCNSFGVGAKIQVDIEQKDGSQRSVYHWVNSGGSFGANPLLASIGLGKNAKRVTRITVAWPGRDDKQLITENIALNSVLIIDEENGAISPI